MSVSERLPCVRAYLTDLQDRLCAALEAIDQTGRFHEECWSKNPRYGGRTRLLRHSALFEQAGIGFSDVCGSALPATASARHPEIAGAHWRAVGVSLIIHPHSPYIPTTHANVRYFQAFKDTQIVASWFGGGFDLTPFYPFDEDILHWHSTAQTLCAPFGSTRYQAHKRWCDRYFYLPHRSETRGVGGLFFDDLQHDFAEDFAYLRAVGDGFIDAYIPIVSKRKDIPYGARERAFQLYRRGRYVEFNLLYDRGTLFGLQSGGRTESILMSLPPLVSWNSHFEIAPGSPEARLAQYLRPRDWLGIEAPASQDDLSVLS